MVPSCTPFKFRISQIGERLKRASVSFPSSIFAGVSNHVAASYLAFASRQSFPLVSRTLSASTSRELAACASGPSRATHSASPSRTTRSASPSRASNPSRLTVSSIASAVALTVYVSTSVAAASVLSNKPFQDLPDHVSIELTGFDRDNGTDNRYSNFVLVGEAFDSAKLDKRHITLNATGGQNAFYCGSTQVGFVGLPHTVLNISGTKLRPSVHVGAFGEPVDVLVGVLSLEKGSLNIERGSMAAWEMSFGGHEGAVDGDSMVRIGYGMLGMRGSAYRPSVIDFYQGSKVILLGYNNHNAAIESDSINLYGGSIETEEQQILTMIGNVYANGGQLSIGEGSAVRILGDAEFAAGSINNRGQLLLSKNDSPLADNRTWRFAASDFQDGVGVIKGKLDSNSIFTLKITDTGPDDVFDLAPAVCETHSTLARKKIDIENGTVVFDAEYAQLLRPSYKQGKSEIHAKELTVGKGGNFEIDGGAKLVVTDAFTVAGEGGNGLTIGSGSVVLGHAATKGSLSDRAFHGNGIVLDAKNSDASSSMLEVVDGTWHLNDLTVNKGKVKVSNGSKLEVKGSLKAKAGSSVVVSASTLDMLSPESKLDIEAKTVSIENTGVLEIRANKILRKGENGACTLANGFQTGMISGDSTSTLKLLSLSGQPIKVANKETLDELVEKIGFGGMISGFYLESKPSDGVDIESISPNSDGFKDVQVHAGSHLVDHAYSVDSVVLDAGIDVLTLAKNQQTKSVGSLIVNSPKNGKFVSKSNGAVADVKLDADLATVVLAGSGEMGSIETTAQGHGRVVVGNLSEGGHVKVAGIGSADHSVGSLIVNEHMHLSSTDDIAAENFVFNGSMLSAADKTVTVGGMDKTVDIMGDMDAQALVIAAEQDVVNIAGDAKVSVSDLTVMSETTTINVGVDGESSTSATVDVGRLTLNKGALIVDPSFDQKAAISTANWLSKSVDLEEGTKAEVLDGKIAVGMNSLVAVGFKDSAEVTSLLTHYGLMEDDKMIKGEIDGAMVLKTPIVIAKDQSIVIDGTYSQAQLRSAIRSYTDKLELGANSALIIHSDVYERNPDGSKKGIAVTFDSGTAGASSAEVDVSNGGRIILAGDFDASDSGLRIFGNVKPIGDSSGFVVESANKVLRGFVVLDGRASVFDVDNDRLNSLFQGASGPIQSILRDKIATKDPSKYDGTKLGAKYLGSVANEKDANGVKADAASHALTYAGAQQVAVAAVSLIPDAIASRIGMNGFDGGMPIELVGTQPSGGIWLTSTYKNVNTDGFNAQGASFGADYNLAGLTFGADRVVDNTRYGMLFNIGSGSADGNGNATGLKDSFDYYGLGLYSSTNLDQLSVVADASVHVVSHNVKSPSGIVGFGDFSANADTTILSVGANANYRFETDYLDLIPHVGARFYRIDTDSYDLNSALGTVATTDFEVQNILSMPVGLTISKPMNFDDWNLAPKADFTVTFNTGDTEVKSHSLFTGAPSFELNTAVIDEVSYGTTLGFDAQHGNFHANLALNYTKSENTDSVSINATTSYMF